MNRVEKLASRYLVGTAPLPQEIMAIAKALRLKDSFPISKGGFFFPMYTTDIIIEGPPFDAFGKGKPYELYDWGLYVTQDERGWKVNASHMHLTNAYTAIEPKAIEGAGIEFHKGSLAEYTTVFNKVVAARKKALTVLLQFARERGDDQKGYAKALQAFIAKWGKGQTWGKVKNVVPMDPDWTHPKSGKHFRLGVVFNMALLKSRVDPNRHWISPMPVNESFRLVWENKTTDWGNETLETEVGAFDLLRRYEGKLDFIQDLREAVEDLNKSVLTPWGRSLGQTE